MIVTMVTEIEARFVRYSVRDRNGRTVWIKEVPFKVHPASYRAGGAAFKQAAREQEAKAKEVVNAKA